MWKTHKRTIVLTLVLTLLPMAAGLILWNRLPQQIPVHFDLHSRPDGYADRAIAVFVIPALAAAAEGLCILVLRADPRRRGVHRRVRTLTLWIMPLLSVTISAVSYAAALGYAVDVGMILCLLLGLLFLALGNYLPKCTQNYTVGVRVPWTLHDPENWRCTHRFAGFVLSFAGLLTMVLAFLAPLWSLAVLTAASLLPVLYSYFYDRKHKEDPHAAD